MTLSVVCFLSFVAWILFLFMAVMYSEFVSYKIDFSGLMIGKILYDYKTVYYYPVPFLEIELSQLTNVDAFFVSAMMFFVVIAEFTFITSLIGLIL